MKVNRVLCRDPIIFCDEIKLCMNAITHNINMVFQYSDDYDRVGLFSVMIRVLMHNFMSDSIFLTSFSVLCFL